MFKRTMAAQLKRIFDFDKVSFDLPGESEEQEGLFIQIETARSRIKDARQIARVSGKIHVFGSLDKLPYGYFTKCIEKADPEDTRPFLFTNFEENKGTFRNIAERTLDFIYLYDSQYDPSIGEISQVNLNYAESEQ